MAVYYMGDDGTFKKKKKKKESQSKGQVYVDDGNGNFTLKSDFEAESREKNLPGFKALESARLARLGVRTDLITERLYGDLLGQDDIAPVKETAKSTKTVSAEEEEELLAGMTPRQRLFHKQSGGFVDTSTSWSEKIATVSQMIVNGEDADYKETDKLLKQLKTRQKRYTQNDFNGGKEVAELQEYYNTLVIAKNKDILSKTKMDGTDRSVLEEMQLLAEMDSGDEKEKRKAAVFKKMEEVGIPKEDYALFTDDKNFSWGTFGKMLARSSEAGLNATWLGFAKTINLLTGQNKVTQEIVDFYQGNYDKYHNAAQLYKEQLGGGGGWQFATEAVEGTMGAVPDAIMAIATAGQSKTGTLATKAAYEAGNWLTKAGLTVEKMFRNPQYWTSFARTLGSDYDEAKANGASDTVAALGSTLSSLINAGIEIGGDGGSGIQGLPDDLLSGDKNKFWAWVMSTFEEGGEEGLQKFVNEIITKTMYNHDADILNPTEYAKEMALGTISGAALGGGQVVVQGGANAYNQYQANKLTDDEKAVLEKEVEKRIADQETDDKKLTSREKNAIREQVRQELEKGGISIATIEEVLGGDTYKQYQDAKAKESAVIKEFESLYKGDELMQEIEKFLENSETLKIKKQLSEEVMGKASGSRLAESYYELGRRKEKFTADLSKYDEKQRAIVQRAINSGVLNNTNRTHEFVDLVAKISADKGVLFDFINNEKLKGTSFAVEGKVVNGFKTEAGEVFLNANAAKSLNTVVGHEITHVLEGTDLYEGLQKVLFDYAKSRKSKSGKFDSEYMERLHDTRQLYKDVKGYEGVQGFDKIKKEVAADLVGDYLFTDPDFIRHLSTKNRNLAQKLYDEIKYMLKVATAGSKEARELERVKKAFEDAWRGEVKKTGENQHSISETTDGRRVAVVDNDILNTIDTSTWDKATKKKAQKAASAELKKFSDGFTINGIEFVGNKDTRDEYTRSNYTDALARKNKTAFLDKMRASAVLDDVIQVATGWKNDNELKHDRDDYIDFVRGNTLILSGDRGYRAVVLAGITEDGRAVFHDVVDIYPDSFEIKKAESSTAVLANESPNAILEDSVAPNVAQDGAKVKQYSLSDGDGAVDSAMTEDVYGREISKRDHAEVQFSLSHDADYMDKAIAKNNDSLAVESSIMEEAKALRERIAERMNAIKDKGLVSLPEDIEGNTYLANSSYDGSEENTTICPRSLASEAFVDAVSEYLGRPLSVEEQIYISQDLQDRSLTPECLYCYVATDRKAYRAFLGDYIEQRDAVLQKLGENPDADISRNGDLYKEFLNGRKDTNPMYSRFKMWADAYKNGKPMIEASHLANMNKLMGDLNSEFGAELRPQIVDAMKYAQSASWAKKRVNYVAYNGHILKWKQNRINKLNSHYGLRMYSFSDFHPAFVLENMQMITDASVRGLKMLGYTKDTDFVEIFAPSGMNINISTFGFNQGDNVFENNVIGAEWEKAKALREQYPNVGITFVATNDTIVNWALKQDWIDVVIPYHLVRTGEVVAEKLGYTNYTKESADTKGVDWTKGADKKYIASTEHNNDKDTYLAALKENHLKPRFERFLGDPNYMKLVNECRQPDSMSKPVQPVFNEDAAMKALAKLEANGYYQPIGGSVDRMYEIAAEVAEEMGKEIAPAQYSLSQDSEGNQLSAGQQEYFKDSQVRDELGRLLAVYHGTENGGFTIFDPSYSDDNSSLFFTDDPNLAATYSGNVLDQIDLPAPKNGIARKLEMGKTKGKGKSGLYKSFLNIKNPLVVDCKGNGWNNIPYGNKSAKTTITENGNVIQIERSIGNDVEKATFTKEELSNSIARYKETYDQLMAEVENWDDGTPEAKMAEAVDRLRNDPVIAFLSTKNNAEGVSGIVTRVRQTLSSWGENADVNGRSKIVQEAMWDDESQSIKQYNTRDIAAIAKAKKHDGVIFKNVYDAGASKVDDADYSNKTVYIAFNSNQVKSVDNKNPTADPDVRYSLSADSEGNQLSYEQEEYFKDSKVRDENGNLKVMYHGTQNGGHYAFDPNYSDDGISLFFVDSNEVAASYSGTSETFAPRSFKTLDDINAFFKEIRKSDYKVIEQDGQYTLYDDDYEVATSESLDDLFEEFKDWEGVGYGSVNYKAYLNLKNPLVVDAEGRDWHSLPGVSGDKTMYEYIKVVAVGDRGEVTIEYSMTGDPAPVTETVDLYKKFDDALADTLSNLAPGESVEGVYTNPSTTRDYVRYAKDNGYDGVIFKNIYDIGGFGNNGASEATVAIAFDANQVKSVANGKPTADPDIRRSLSNEGDEHPVYGSYNVYGKDVAYEEDFAPVKETVAKASNQPVTEAVDQPVVSPAETAVETTETEQNVPIAENVPQTEADMFPDENVPETDSEFYERMDSLAEMDAPMERPVYNDGGQVDVIPITKKLSDDIRREVRSSLGLSNKQMADVRAIIEKYTNSEFPSREELFTELKDKFGTYTESYSDEMVTDAKTHLRTTGLYVDDFIKSEIADYADLMRRNRGRIRFSKNGVAVDTLYHEMNSLYPHLFPESIIAPTDQLMQMIDVANMESTTEYERDLSDSAIYDVADSIMRRVSEYRQTQKLIQANRSARDSFNGLMQDADSYVPPVDLNKILANRQKTNIPSNVPEAEIHDTSSGQQAMWQEPTDLEKAYSRIDRILESDKAALAYELEMKKKTVKDADSLRKLESDYRNKVAKLEYEAEAKKKTAETANQRKVKTEEYSTHMEDLVGDTTYWKDKKLGLSYKTNTLRRNLRDVVRDANGNRDIATADAIYDELQGSYNHNEAILKRESAQIKKPYADMKITSAEDAYIQMLGELRHNPDTTLTDDVVNEFYEKHKKQIDTYKVERAIEDARRTYDDLLLRVNAVLKEQGMKEIPYRKGYFPHFTEDKQGFLAKLFNWKAKNFDIPTDIAGLTEQFNPNRSWQSFNKQRKGDTTDYSFTKGMDSYVHGALDWIHHIEDIQKRRAFENHIRYVHSEKGVQERIDKIRNNNELDADEMQEQIDLVFAEAENPLNNFVTDLRAGTNTLAGKKSSLDRGMEEMVNRKVYSVMTNLSNRVTGNMVAGSVSSALTNFIPITQSWGQVSPVSSLRAMGDTIRSAVRDDGMIDKSDFLTNRLRAEDNLYKSGWDKFGEKATFLMEGIDSFTAQVVWRSKYLENISDGMSENAAIKNADQFAENVIAGRSRGNMPTIFDSKNPLIKTLTAFQLEVNNQYGYMFKDMPQDLRNDSVAKLVKGYATMFMGAYAYNALYSSLVGRDAAFDPISIIEDLLKDLGLFDDDDEEKEPEDIILNLAENVLEEVPFVGGLLGGGRVPISAALPYDSLPKAFSGTVTDIADGDWTNLTKEWLNPVYYLAMPLGGGQLKKTVEGLSMFSDEHPVSGSYTASGNLRFPVEDTIGNRIQAGLFGQYASKNAREYFDNEWAPLGEKQIQEYIDVEIPFKDYHEYREGLKGKDTLGEKVAYISGLDLPIAKKNILVNNQSSRKDPIDMTDYTEYSDWGEFDYAKKYPEKYEFLKANNISVDEYESFDEDTKNAYSWAYQNPEKFTLSKAVSSDLVVYKSYTSDLADIKADKDKDGKSISGSRKKKVVNYINGLNASYGEKIVLFKSEYPSDDTYNQEIIQYIESRTDFDFDDKRTVLEELGFTVKDDGTVTWN